MEHCNLCFSPAIEEAEGVLALSLTSRLYWLGLSTSNLRSLPLLTLGKVEGARIRINLLLMERKIRFDAQHLPPLELVLAISAPLYLLHKYKPWIGLGIRYHV